MNLTDFTYLINKPDAINERYNLDLEKIVDEFPYFQSARVLRLKYLYNQDSFKYNHALKVAAAFTTDRSILFDFITSDIFISIQNGLYNQKISQILDINVLESEVVENSNLVKKNNPIEDALFNSIKHSNTNNEITENKLEIGKPFSFTKNETHSFQEWLQLSRHNPIKRQQTIIEEDAFKKKKLELIDKFIENNPKIPPINKDNSSFTIQPKIEDTTYLMTETLAKVYLEQKKYSKAIQAYEILILKYPEKSSFFANRILNIKSLQ